MIKITKNLVLFAVAFSVTTANAGINDAKPGYSTHANYDWFNQVVNNTPATGNVVDVDVNQTGYKVALQTSFYGSISGSLSQWYQASEIWTSIAIGPMVNSFGIIFTKVDNLDQMDAAKDKTLPLNVQALTNWNSGDSAYWESQGGITFYAGFGTGIVGLGTFAVASGGWANYLEKTGPSTVYVERAKMKIDSISFGANVGPVNMGMEDVVSSAKGLNFEFNFDIPGSSEAFERFMAGDAANAMLLSKDLNSGVRKVSDTNSRMSGRAFSIGLATPIVPLFSFKSTKTNDVNHEEEITSTDEIIVKDYGVYKKSKVLRLIVANHRKESTLFKGGVTSVTTGSGDQRYTTEKMYGNFKYTYQSDFGTEEKLNDKINYAKTISGLANERETAVTVPPVTNSLKYNQVILEMNLSDDYLREIIGNGKASVGFLDRMQERALANHNRTMSTINCNQVSYGDGGQTNVDPMCQLPSVESVFKKLKESAQQIRTGLTLADRKGFSQAMANFGKVVWSHPGVFSAFYETGRACGVELKFEVSGERITRFARSAKHEYKETCY
jgi:hypothetical protein